MANENESSYNLNIDVSSNTGPAVQGFYQLGALTKQIRTDIGAIEEGVSGITERADTMRKYFEENFEVLGKMSSVLETIQAMLQTNQTNFSNNINALNEMLGSVKGLGGNMSHVLGMLGIGGMGGGGGAGYGGAAYPSTAAADFTNTFDNERRGIFSRYLKGSGRNGGGGGGGRRRGFGDDDDSGDEEASFNDDALRGRSTFRGIRRAPIRTGPTASTQKIIQRQLAKYPWLQKRFADKNILPPGREGRAAEFAYQDMMDQISTVSDALPFGLGSTLPGRIKDIFSSAGIDLQSIRRSQASNTTVDAEGNITRTGGIPEGVETQALKAANAVSRIFLSNVVQNFTKFTGYASIAGNLIGMGQDIAGNIRQYTAMGQAMGGQMGEVNYGRSIGMAGQAFLKSDFNLNPFYSTQDVMQNQIMGMGLGLKGNQLSNYVNTGIQFQTQYGLTAQQAQGIIGTGLGAGVNINQNANAFAQVRNLENSTTTSTAYGNQAYQQGLTSYAGMGATGATAAQLGAQVAGFAANDLVGQAAGLTGTEGIGSVLNNALLAQKMGVSYTGLFGAMRSASSSTISKAQNATQEEILGWAGININATYKDKKDFLNQNQSKIMVLQMILQSLVQQGSQSYASAASSPQKAADWAWLIVRQKQQMKNSKQKSGSFFGHIMGDIGKAAGVAGNVLNNVVDAPGSLVGNVVHGINDVGGFVGGTLTGQSFSQIVKANNQNNAQYDNTIGRFVQPGTNLISPIANGISTASRYAGNAVGDAVQKVEVVVGIHPKAMGIITASKAATAGFNNGKVSPNVQPTRT